GIGFDGGSSVGLTADQMQQQSSFAGFDFNTSPVWRIYEGHTTPLLKNFLVPLTVTVSGGGASKTYDGDSEAFFSGSLVSYSGLTGGDTGVPGTLKYENARNVGSYNVSGLYSTKYDISYTGSAGQLVIQPRTVSVVLDDGTSKVYDGTTVLNWSGTPQFSNAV